MIRKGEGVRESLGLDSLICVYRSKIMFNVQMARRNAHRSPAHGRKFETGKRIPPTVSNHFRVSMDLTTERERERRERERTNDKCFYLSYSIANPFITC